VYRVNRKIDNEPIHEEGIMPRTARLDAPGTLHHVIVRGIERRKAFVGRMSHLAIETKTVIYAWALLNNHAHILLRSSEFGLFNFMRRFLTGYAIRRLFSFSMR